MLWCLLFDTCTSSCALPITSSMTVCDVVTLLPCAGNLMGHHNSGGMGGGMEGGMGGGMGGMGGQPTVIENNYYGSNPQVQQGTQASAGCLLLSAPLNLAGREALHPSGLASNDVDSPYDCQCGRTMVAEASALAAAMPLVQTLEIQAMVEGPPGTSVVGRTWAEGEARITEAGETLVAAAAVATMGAGETLVEAAGETLVEAAGATLVEAAGATLVEAAGEIMEEAVVRAFPGLFTHVDAQPSRWLCSL